jgi:hypothetical protein
MRITAGGWGRSHGEKEIMKGPLGDTNADSDGRLGLHRGYFAVKDAYSKGAKIKVSAGTEEVRMGGRAPAHKHSAATRPSLPGRSDGITSNTRHAFACRQRNPNHALASCQMRS